MYARIDTRRINPDAYKAMRSLQAYVDASGLDPRLQELVKIRMVAFRIPPAVASVPRL